MSRPRKDTNKITAKQVAKVTKTPPPSGGELLGSAKLIQAFTKAKASLKNK